MTNIAPVARNGRAPGSDTTKVGSAAGRTPVFVDPSGRRGRVLSRICWTLGALMAGYVALVVISLLGPPGLSKLSLPGLGPVLPGPAPAPLGTGDGPRRRPAQVMPRPS
ncbi:MAG: hypothetical protein LC779_10345, partial [Actinobacteria bacterium]|nr:hypothetical protein [Actinomycetota bacterium]